MGLTKKSLESDIISAIESRLSTSVALSDKAKGRIEKSAGKLAEKLLALFEKEARKAEKKTNSAEDVFSDED